MKKLLFFILLFFVGVTAAFAQAPTHEQLTYQTVVRNAQNQLVFNQDNVTVKVYVCSDAAGTNVVYSETHTALSTNANGMLSMMIGSVAPDEGTWAGIDWSTAYIKTTISYNPGSGTVTITHDPAPVTAVPYALSAGNTSNITNLIGDAIHDSIVNNIENNISEQIHDSIVNNINTTINQQIHDSIVNNINNNISEQIHDSIVDALGDYQIQNCDDVNDCVATAIADGNSDINHAIDTVVLNNIGDAIHDSIVNNISEQIHDSITNYLTVGDYVTETDLCTTIETNCTNVALRNGNTFTGEHHFTGADSVTVPDAITPDLATALASPCTQEAVNLCDLLAVFDSLNRRIQELADDLDELKNAIPPVANAPTVSNVTSTSMNVKANATSQGAAITSYEFCYSINSDMSGATCQTVLASDADNVTFTGLDPNTNYYVQYSATNFAGTTSSPIVMAHTPAHAPTADVTPPAPIKPAGFDVHVDDVDPKEKDEATVQVCYVLKGSSDCPEKESPSYSACTDPVTVTDGGSAIISQTGLEASTEYCVIVKVSNEDSTTIYGPFTVTTGADVTMTVANDGGGTVNLCGESTKDVTFTATITGGNASDFTYTWSTGATASGNTATYSLAAGIHTVYVTATHTTESYTLTGTASVTIASGGTAATLKLCEEPSIGKVLVDNTNCTSLSWKNSSDEEVSTSLTELAVGGGITAGVYTVTGVNASGCSITKQVVLGNYSPRPCTSSSMGSHSAQTTGIGNATDGMETVESGNIISVKDYDGNEYPVVEIGSQCWTAVNMRATHYADGSDVPAGTTSNSSTTAPYYYDHSSSSIPLVQRGYIYNWPAAMKSTNTEGTQGVCPTGWHVPTRADWQTMVAAADAATLTGAVYLSSSCYWNGSTSGTGSTSPNSYDNPERNKSVFSAVPVGFFTGASFNYSGDRAYFCSSSQNASSSWWHRYLNYNSTQVLEDVAGKGNGYSVRCVRDTVAPAVRPVLSVSAASGTVNLCGGETAEAAFTATPSSGNTSDFTYTWSTGATASGNTATYSFGEGTHTVYVTATHTTESYTLTGTASVTIASGGTAATLSLCEDWYQSKVTVRSTNCTSLSWVSDATGTEVSTSTTELQESGAIPAGAYTVKGVNASGCSITKQCVLGNYNPKPCTSESRGTHVPQVSGTYTPAYGSDGLETVDASGDITSVKDIDNNEYKVVEIGSQCWMAVNLRTTKYADNTSITHGTTSNSTTVRYYYDYSSSSIPLGERGYLYNWPAAMKGTTAEGTQGVCPTGWHLPTKTEWQTMVASADASTSTGAVYLSASCYWSGSNSATNGMTPNSYDNPDCNKSGFSAVPAGRFLGSSFDGSGDYADFWSSSLRDTNAAWNRYLNSSNANVYENSNHSYYGFSVRCVRNN